jgi:hypothetical protein
VFAIIRSGVTDLGSGTNLFALSAIPMMHEAEK